MKFGLRFPSIKKRIAARLSWKRYLRHSVGLKAPRGFGVFTNRKKFIYNFFYNRTSVSLDRVLKFRKSKNQSAGCGCLTLIVIAFAMMIIEQYWYYFLGGAGIIIIAYIFIQSSNQQK